MRRIFLFLMVFLLFSTLALATAPLTTKLAPMDVRFEGASIDGPFYASALICSSHENETISGSSSSCDSDVCRIFREYNYPSDEQCRWAYSSAWFEGLVDCKNNLCTVGCRMRDYAGSYRFAIYLPQTATMYLSDPVTIDTLTKRFAFNLHDDGTVTINKTTWMLTWDLMKIKLPTMLLALFLTLFIELALAVLFLWRTNGSWKLLWWVAGVNLFTVPGFWLLAPRYSWEISLLFGQFALLWFFLVFVAEALSFRYLAKLPFTHAFLLSFFANLSSVVLTMFIIDSRLFLLLLAALFSF